MGSAPTIEPSDARYRNEAQESAAEGLRTLRAVSGYLLSGDAAQFVHTFVRIEGSEHGIRHAAAKCWLCEALGAIETALLDAHARASQAEPERASCSGPAVLDTTPEGETP